MPNYVKPTDVVEMAVSAGFSKGNLPVLDMVIRGLYSGIMLGVSSTLSAAAQTQTGLPIAGALLFPCGFLMIVLYGFELVTGNMLLLPIALLARKTTLLKTLKNLGIVWICNLLGTSLYLAFFYGSVTYFGEVPDGGAIGQTIITIGKNKTIKYEEHGGLGWAACFFKAILCNFLVSFAALGSLSSTGTVGKVVGCWIPVIMFASLGYEHVVVNMFMIPCSMALGSGVTWGQWWGWNMVPATLGNAVGAMLMVSVPFWITWGHEYRKKQKVQDKLDAVEVVASSPLDSYDVAPFPNNSPEHTMH